MNKVILFLCVIFFFVVNVSGDSIQEECIFTDELPSSNCRLLPITYPCYENQQTKQLTCDEYKSTVRQNGRVDFMFPDDTNVLIYKVGIDIPNCDYLFTWNESLVDSYIFESLTTFEYVENTTFYIENNIDTNNNTLIVTLPKNSSTCYAVYGSEQSINIFQSVVSQIIYILRLNIYISFAVISVSLVLGIKYVSQIHSNKK